jgi:triosephosphate isomerase
MKKIIVGNWKMNGDKQLVDEFVPLLNTFNCDCVICPPFTLIDFARRNLPKTVFIGAQDCSAFDCGPHTGEVSCKQISEVGCTHVILGHSERRKNNNENDEIVTKKFKCAIENKLIPIVCGGESKEEYECGKTINVISNQISFLLQYRGIVEFFVAYEPIWAIGTGQTPTISEVDNIHKYMYNSYGMYPIYGGSVTYKNHKDFLNLTYVSGLLIGGARLHASEISKIILC